MKEGRPNKMFAQWRSSDGQLLFLPFSLCGNKSPPPDQFLIRRLTEQARPLAVTLHSLIPLRSSTPPSLLPRSRTCPADLTQTSKNLQKKKKKPEFISLCRDG